MASDNILVAIKSRPFITREKTEKLKSQWVVQQDAIYQIDDEGHRAGEPYTFDHIFNETSSNEDVYNTVVEPLVKSCLRGFNSTIFAYGQTSSGKTYTMLGNNDIPGIIQHAVNDIFRHLEESTQRRYLIRCSYFEIYKEKINDLFDKNGQDLRIREDICGNTFVNAKQEVVSKATHVFDLMKVGNKMKKIGSTNMNERSSRSHTIFRFTIESTENGLSNGPVQISQLNLVDLAGSERISHTKVVGVRLDEGININKSLSALGNVIRQLSDGEGFVSYRDSKLTRLLQQALGGNAKALIIATITLAVGDETKSTLEFAQRAKIVKNRPIINEILTEQDKLKQYELVTADYKDRLEKETLRIQEMQLEKERREKEISKLKENFKLINLFLKGKDTKPLSRIPRRHTVGHYGSQMVLEPIPEINTPSTSRLIPSKISVDDCVEEECSESVSGGLDESAELSEDSPLNISYQSLQTRVQHLEDSLISLKEFTRFEAEFKDLGVVEALRLEKECLVKDLADYNSIIIEERQKWNRMKMQLESEVKSLKEQLEQQKNVNKDSQVALNQANAEMALLTELEKAEHNAEFVFDQPEYETQENQNKSDDEESTNSCNEMRKEINNLQEENYELQDRVDNIHTKYEEEISLLQEKCKNLERRRAEEDAEILSKLCYLKDILEVNRDVQNNLDEKRTKDILEAEIAAIKDEKAFIEIENNEFVKTIHQLQTNMVNLETKCSELLLKEEIQERDTLSIKDTLHNKIVDNRLLKIEIEEIKKEKINTQNRNSELITKIKVMKKETENMLKYLKDMHENIETHNSNLMEQIEEIGEETKAACKQVEKHKMTLQTEMEHKEECIKKLLEEVEAVTYKCENFKMSVEELQEDKTILQIQNEQLETVIATLNAKIQSLQELNQELELDNSKCKEKVGYLDLEQLIQRYNETLKDVSESTSTSTHEIVVDRREYYQGKQMLIDKIGEMIAEKYRLKDEIDAIKLEETSRNSSMVSRIHELETVILEFKARIETMEKLVSSSTYKLATNLSPKEMRRIKRQSIYDERRKINVGDEAAATCSTDDFEATLTRLETEIRKLVSSQREDEFKSLKQEVEDLKMKAQYCSNCKLKDIRIVHLENLQQENMFKIVQLETKIYDLQNIINVIDESQEDRIQFLNDKISALETRQDFEMKTVAVQCELNHQSEEIERLKNQVEKLVAENTFLESEAQGFMRELNDLNTYYKEQKAEIAYLTDKIKQMKVKKWKCLACENMQKRLGELQALQRHNVFKLVDMQTKIYDLNNKHKIETATIEDKCQFLQNYVVELESKLKNEKLNKSVQCDLMNYEHLRQKYINMKKLAQLRREEGNKLRVHLGLLPDEPAP